MLFAFWLHFGYIMVIGLLLLLFGCISGWATCRQPARQLHQSQCKASAWWLGSRKVLVSLFPCKSPYNPQLTLTTLQTVLSAVQTNTVKGHANSAFSSAD